MANQLLDGILPTWLANPHNPAMSPHSTPSTHHIGWISGRKEEGVGGKLHKERRRKLLQTLLNDTEKCSRTRAPMMIQRINDVLSLHSSIRPLTTLMQKATDRTGPLGLWLLRDLTSCYGAHTHHLMLDKEIAFLASLADEE